MRGEIEMSIVCKHNIGLRAFGVSLSAAAIWNTDSTISSTDSFLYDILFFKVLLILVVFAIVFIINRIGNKVHSKIYHGFAIIFLLSVICAVSIRWTISGSIQIAYLSLAFIMTATIFILRFIRFSLPDYIAMFSCFYFVARFVGFTPDYFGTALPILYVFLVLLTISKFRLKRLNGNLFYIWFAAIFTATTGYLYNAVNFKYIYILGLLLDSDVKKLAVWGGSTLALIAIGIALNYILKHLLQYHFDNISRMGKAFPKIERFFIYSSFMILVLMSSVYFVSRMIYGYASALLDIFNIFTLIALAMQLSFLVMIYRITWLKNNLNDKMLENERLAFYTSGLERNMDNIKHIKHDLKNVFLTMGRFVEQSDNVEMQNYYHEMICPFANEEIVKNDLYGKLMTIDNEQLRAFLYYKLSQATKLCILLELDISTDYSSAQTKMEFTDLVRVLGILLDNAIEECTEVNHGTVYVAIAQNNELVAYKVKNTVTQQRRENGVKLHVSTKGDGRGTGLWIARSIIDKYDFITLNSYFDDDGFVQNLMVYRPNHKEILTQ